MGTSAFPQSKGSYFTGDVLPIFRADLRILRFESRLISHTGIERGWGQLMLEYKIADYCIIIWDSDRTTLGESLKGLQEQSMQVPAHVETDKTTEDLSSSLLESTCAVRAYIEYEGKSGITLREICRTVALCIELATALGFDGTEVNEALQIAFGNED